MVMKKISNDLYIDHRSIEHGFSLFKSSAFYSKDNKKNPMTSNIGVSVKVVHLHYISVYCACLSVMLDAFRFFFKLSRMATLLRKSLSFYFSCVLLEKCFCCVNMYFLSHLVSMLG